MSAPEISAPAGSVGERGSIHVGIMGVADGDTTIGTELVVLGMIGVVNGATTDIAGRGVVTGLTIDVTGGSVVPGTIDGCEVKRGTSWENVKMVRVDKRPNMAVLA